jgi:hypothetical protein
MKTTSCLLLLLLLSGHAFATEIGDTYNQVIAERGKPKSQIDAGSRRLLQYPDAAIELRDNLVTNIKAITPPPTATTPAPAPAAPAKAPPATATAAAPKPAAQPSSSSTAKIAALQRELNQAVNRVKEIVNQPVKMVQRTPQMKVGMWGPGGWFHEGAEEPDFANVDVRKTQDLTFGRFEFVSSDINPGVAFMGRELEYNSMTKIFYMDRSIPKKKLSEKEMLEINELYRVIGRCTAQLKPLMESRVLPVPAPAPASPKN